MKVALQVASSLLAGAMMAPIATRAADIPATRVIEPPPPPAVSTAPKFTVYSLVDVVYLENRFPGRFYKSHIYQSSNGINVGVTPELSIGGGFIYSRSVNSLTYLAGRSQGDGFTGYLTATLNVQSLFTAGAAAGLGTFSVDQVRPVGGSLSFATPNSKSNFMSAYIQKDFTWGAFSLTPRARVLWAVTDTRAYVESLNSFNPAQTSRLGEVAIGATAAYAVSAGSMTLYPMLEANFLYDFQLPLYQRDRTAFELKAGVSATAGDLSFGLAYVTIAGRSEYSTYHGGRAFMSYQF